MIIKKGTKYYKIEKEMTSEEVDIYRNRLQSYYDSFDDELNEEVKRLKDERKITKDNLKAELDELNAL